MLQPPVQQIVRGYKVPCYSYFPVKRFFLEGRKLLSGHPVSAARPYIQLHHCQREIDKTCDQPLVKQHNKRPNSNLESFQPTFSECQHEVLHLLGRFSPRCRIDLWFLIYSFKFYINWPSILIIIFIANEKLSSQDYAYNVTCLNHLRSHIKRELQASITYLSMVLISKYLNINN